MVATVVAVIVLSLDDSSLALDKKIDMLLYYLILNEF